MESSAMMYSRVITSSTVMAAVVGFGACFMGPRGAMTFWALRGAPISSAAPTTAGLAANRKTFPISILEEGDEKFAGGAEGFADFSGSVFTILGHDGLEAVDHVLQRRLRVIPALLDLNDIAGPLEEAQHIGHLLSVLR